MASSGAYLNYPRELSQAEFNHRLEEWDKEDGPRVGAEVFLNVVNGLSSY